MNKFKINKLKCAGCGACLQACPYGAIKIEKDRKAFIDQSKCQKCGKCQEVCPFDAIEKISNEENIKQLKISPSLPSSPATFPYGPSPAGGRNLGAGRGRGLGRGPRDGRGGGRGGGGRGR